MPRLTLGLALLSVLIAAVCVAGCGSSSSTTETTTALSKAEFLAMGNAVCVKGEKAQKAEINAFMKENGLANKKPSAAQETKMVETVLAPNIKGQINGVKALAAPSSVEKQVDTGIELAEEALEEVEANPTKALGNGPSPFAAAGKELHAVGLTKCAPNS